MQYRRKPYTVEAMQWDGRPATAAKMITWMLKHGEMGEYRPVINAFVLHAIGGNQLAMPPGSWLVLTDDEFPLFRYYSKERFEREFEPIVNSPITVNIFPR